MQILPLLLSLDTTVYDETVKKKMSSGSSDIVKQFKITSYPIFVSCVNLQNEERAFSGRYNIREKVYTYYMQSNIAVDVNMKWKFIFVKSSGAPSSVISNEKVEEGEVRKEGGR